MDTKVTLSFEIETIEKAKTFAASQGVSLSRLTEFLYEKITATPKGYASLDDIPVSDFINMLSEPAPEYKSSNKAQKSLKKEFYESRK